MGEYCYEFEVNSAVLKSLVGEKVLSFEKLEWGDYEIKFETFSAIVSQIYQIATQRIISEIVIEDIECNSLCVGIKIVGNPVIARLYRILDNSKVALELFKELNSYTGYASHKLLAVYK